MLLYDADRIEAAASVEDPKSLYEAQLGVFLDPHAPEVLAEARKQGIPEAWLTACLLYTSDAADECCWV